MRRNRKEAAYVCGGGHAPPTMLRMTKDWTIGLALGVALAGGLGTLARWGLATLLQRNVATEFPVGVFLINLLGCLLFGLVVALAEQKQWLGPGLRVVLLTGFMGAFTTFSTFAYDTTLLAREAQWGALVLNVAGQNLLGVVCIVIGLRLGQAL